MSKMYVWVKGSGREIGLPAEEEMTVRINVGTKDDSREIIKVLVEDAGDAFVVSIEGEEFRRMPKARWEK